MRFQQLNRDDADKVYSIVKNTSGATIAANIPVYVETDAQSDGHAVSQAVDNGGLLFKGVTDVSVTDDGIAEVQVYGPRTSCVFQGGDSAVSWLPGQQLIASAGNDYLAPFSATSSAQASPENFVTLMETVASAAANSNTTTNVSVFIRAL